MEANNKVVVKPAKPAPRPEEPKMVEPGADAKVAYITHAVNSVFLNLKHHEESPDRYEVDYRSTVSDIDNLIAVLNVERKRAKQREINHRSQLIKEAFKATYGHEEY